MLILILLSLLALSSATPPKDAIVGKSGTATYIATKGAVSDILVLRHTKGSSVFTVSYNGVNGLEVKRDNKVFTVNYPNNAIRKYALLSNRVIMMLSSSIASESSRVFFEKTNYLPYKSWGKRDIKNRDYHECHTPFIFAAQELIDVYASFLTAIIKGDVQKVAPHIKSIEQVHRVFEPGVNALVSMIKTSRASIVGNTMMFASGIKDKGGINFTVDMLERMGVALPETFSKFFKWAGLFSTLDKSCPKPDADVINPINQTLVDHLTSQMHAPLIDKRYPLRSSTKDLIRKGIEAGVEEIMDSLDGFLGDQIADLSKSKSSFAAFEMQRLSFAKSRLQSTFKPKLMADLDSLIFETPWIRRILTKGDKWCKAHEDKLKKWLKEVGDFFTSLVSSDTSDVKKVVEQEAKKYGGLFPGEAEVIMSIFQSIQAHRLKNCISVRKEAEDGTWGKGYKFKPKLELGGELIKELGVAQTYTIDHASFKEQVGLAFQIDDLFDSKIAQFKATASWKLKSGYWTAGAAVDVVVLGIFNSEDRMIKTAMLSTFAGYDNGKIKTGIFVSTTMAFKKDPVTKEKSMGLLVHFEHSLAWTPNANVELASNIKVGITHTGSLHSVTAGGKVKVNIVPNVAIVGQANLEYLANQSFMVNSQLSILYRFAIIPPKTSNPADIGLRGVLGLNFQQNYKYQRVPPVSLPSPTSGIAGALTIGLEW